MVYGNLTKNNSELVQEMKANQKKLLSMNEYMNIVKQYMQGFINVIGVYADAHKFILAGFKVIDSSNDTKKVDTFLKGLDDQKKKIINALDKFEKERPDMRGSDAYNKLFSILNKFNIKYSDEVMENKEKIGKELDDYQKKLLNAADGWATIEDGNKNVVVKGNNWKEIISKFESINNKIESGKLKISDTVFDSIIDAVNSIHSRFSKEVCATLYDIRCTKRMLQLDTKEGKFYGIINKIFKTKKKSTNESTTLLEEWDNEEIIEF